jgi:hypothetical protein
MQHDPWDRYNLTKRKRRINHEVQDPISQCQMMKIKKYLKKLKKG